MPSRRVLRRSLLGLALLLVTLLVVGIATVTALVRRPYPEQDGEATLPRLDHAVTVRRDEHGIPQIAADSADDLFRAQGYVHAQDQFFQMDWRRHVTSGRISELVGADPGALQADKVVRTLGWRQLAQRQVDQADPQTRRYLDDYAEGVNTYLRGRSAAELSLNYTLLGLDHQMPPIEPWTPADSVSWFSALAWQLRGNETEELDRARIYGSVHDVSRVDQLFPAYPYAQHAPIVTGPQRRASAAPAHAAGTGGSGSAADAALRPMIDDALAGGPAQRAIAVARGAMDAVPLGHGGDAEIGSNAWAVSGSLTASGKPLLANDPHLAPSIPGTWYQVGLHCRTVSNQCPFDVAGFSFVGVPGVVIGHNARISWGMTNLGPDVTDLYLEKVTGDTVERDGVQVPLSTRTETIRVAGRSPVTITVRTGPHGPLLSDVQPELTAAGVTAPVTGSAAGTAPDRGSGYAVALAWTGLTAGHDMDAVFAVDAARDFTSFRAGAQRLDVPAQNMVYADVDGHIGYVATGRIPLRSTATPVGADAVPIDGSWPLPGWTSEYDWRGTVPTVDLPAIEDPAEGFVVAANQAVTPPGGRVSFTKDFDYGYRSQRIRDLLLADSKHKLTVADMTSIQTDTRNGIAPELVPLLLKTRIGDSFYDDAVHLLQGWDYTQPVDSAPAAFFNAVWANLLKITFYDEIPAGSRPDGGGRWFEVIRRLLADQANPWWDDRGTPSVVETRDAVIRQAVINARDELTRSLGKDPEAWRWGTLHRLGLRSVPLGSTPATLPLRKLMNRGPLDAPGGSSIVDAYGWDATTGTFDVNWAPSMRMVVDLSSLDGSRWVNQTGQSDHPGQGNYADQLDAWMHGRTFGWAFGEQAVAAATRQTLVLKPGK